MKRFLTFKMSFFVTLIPIFLCVVTVSLAAKSDFRNVIWGMSKKEVIKAEGKDTVSENENDIEYNRTIVDDNYILRYHFIENKLTEASYLKKLPDEYFAINVKSELYIKAYEDLKDILIAKYGPPKLPKEYELCILNKENNILKKQWLKSRRLLGFQVYSSEAYLINTWATDEVQVAILLKRKSMSEPIICKVAFFPKKFDTLRKKEKEKEKETRRKMEEEKKNKALEAF